LALEAAGGLNARRDLEPVLDRLMEEFKIGSSSVDEQTFERAVLERRYARLATGHPLERRVPRRSRQPRVGARIPHLLLLEPFLFALFGQWIGPTKAHPWAKSRQTTTGSII